MESIPISAVAVGADEERLVLEVLRSGHLVQGPMVARLEALFTELTGTAHAIAVSSGTTALVAALWSADLSPGDEVVTSPFTFAASLNSILEAGAVARFVDIGDDFNLAADELSGAISDRTRVVMPVHLYGLPADMDPILEVAGRHDLLVVEDAAQAIGARYFDRPVGSMGLGCFSLYATKNVTSGEGGVITTESDIVARRFRLLRSQGMETRYQYEIPGRNYRMTDVQAAIGIPQLGRIDEITAKRRANAEGLSQGLVDLAGLILPAAYPGRDHVFHQYTIRVTSDARVDRDELARRLGLEGIGTGIYYPRVVFDYPCYLSHPNVVAEEVPNARCIASEVLSLPVHPGVTKTGVDRIVEACWRILG